MRKRASELLERMSAGQRRAMFAKMKSMSGKTTTPFGQAKAEFKHVSGGMGPSALKKNIKAAMSMKSHLFGASYESGLTKRLTKKMEKKQKRNEDLLRKSRDAAREALSSGVAKLPKRQSAEAINRFTRAKEKGRS